eukprot:tig00000215_g18530.t1
MAFDYWGINLGVPTSVLGISTPIADLTDDEVEDAFRRTMSSLKDPAALQGPNFRPDPQQLNEWFSTLRQAATFAYRVLISPAVRAEMAKHGPRTRLVADINHLAAETPEARCRKSDATVLTATVLGNAGPLCVPRAALGPTGVHLENAPSRQAVRLRRPAATPPAAADREPRPIVPPPAAALASPSEPPAAASGAAAAAPRTRRSASAAADPKNPPSPPSGEEAEPPALAHAEPSGEIKVGKTAFRERTSLNQLRSKLGLPQVPPRVALAEFQLETARECAKRGIDISHCQNAPKLLPEGETAPPAEGDGSPNSKPPAPDNASKRPKRKAAEIGASSSSSPEEAPAPKPLEDRKESDETESLWTSIKEEDVVDPAAAKTEWESSSFFQKSRAALIKFLRKHFPTTERLAVLNQLSLEGIRALVVLLARRLGFPEIDAENQVGSKFWTTSERTDDVLADMIKNAIAKAQEQAVASIKKEPGITQPAEPGPGEERKEDGPPATPAASTSPPKAAASTPKSNAGAGASGEKDEQGPPERPSKRVVSEVEEALLRRIEAETNPEKKRKLETLLEQTREMETGKE